jgi:GT2 family glycosyltransferase
MRVFVGIATSGRREVLAQAIDSIRTQELLPDLVVVCVPAEEVISADAAEPPVVILHATKGSCTQRNAILDFLGDQSGLLLIIDDDFILHKSYLRLLQKCMKANPNVAILNGVLAADGIGGPGLSKADAETHLANISGSEDDILVEDCASIYGCNMAINLEKVGSTRFDENLPLYGWQEDVDFSAQLKKSGRVVRANIVAGVHLGVKVGRTAGVKFGYSQIINPIYLVRKGTMKFDHALRLICRNVAMNIVRSIFPESYIDRRGRLKGNIMGLLELTRGRVDPRHVTSI